MAKIRQWHDSCFVYVNWFLKRIFTMSRFLKSLAAVTVLAGVGASAHAAQIVLTPANVINSSTPYDTRFVAGNIFNNQSGVVSEPSQNGYYWLNPDNSNATAFIEIDLGAVYSLASIQLFNTHNWTYNDRGTGNFTILGSNSAVLSSFTTVVLADQLNPVSSGSSGNDPILGQSFNVSGSFQYLEFLPTSVAATAPYSGTAYGLNELRISAVPEPTTWAMLLVGFGLIGFGVRAARRRSLQVSYG
jgi:hypothetical protein